MENTLILLKSAVKENKGLEPLKIGKNTQEIELIYAQGARMLAAYLEHPQTFDLILPNLIHKSKKRNLR